MLPPSDESILPADNVPMTSGTMAMVDGARPITLRPRPSTGFSLYLRFPKKLNPDRRIATDHVKQLCDKIFHVRFPRQRSANYCLVDFLTEEDCVKSHQILQRVRINERRLIIKAPTTEKHDVLVDKIEKMSAKRAAKSALDHLIKNIRKSMKQKYNLSCTNGVLIKDIPRSVKETDIKSLFRDIVEFRLVVPKHQNRSSIAFITLPTPKDALKATNQKVMLGGKSLAVTFQKDPPEPKSEAAHGRGPNNSFPRPIQIKVDQTDETAAANTSGRYFQTVDAGVDVKIENETTAATADGDMKTNNNNVQHGNDIKIYN